MAVLHRDTGAYQVRYAGMELYTDQNDARFSEGLPERDGGIDEPLLSDIDLGSDLVSARFFGNRAGRAGRREVALEAALPA